ncbi:Ribulose bisphosphate carboxylase small chain [Thioalkalivibrio nitratireducens DSM 14787]|uniref:Ribulose bisphosphate carboxylase small subunit n=1 Tax=Thioalkalivibrio nitratireducens (strain DSM 14787 / UNIQEM 213 / ALEN2) TaxID=1255043 RepID=L0E002_THIND|nr:ribulose bisphosphate carboxylase small subunit [Thioalkalivibrio nitratireducens]AGA34628.1 Ribulose bisphosphate carboxylase small chain [Thioalkalivibrio nitratireducens DSM 14787]
MATMYEMGDYQTAQTLETFGFLPKLSQDEVHEQIAYIIAQGWTPAIEHEHPSKAFNHYWPMWKLPFFGDTDLGHVVAELEACRRAYPDHHIRLLGYDAYAQTQGASFVVYEGRG